MKRLLAVLLILALAATAVWAVVYVCRFFSENAGESGSFFFLWEIYPVLFACMMAGELGLYFGVKYLLAEPLKKLSCTVVCAALLPVSAVCIAAAVSAVLNGGFLRDLLPPAALIGIPILSVPAIFGLIAAESLLKRRTEK